MPNRRLYTGADVPTMDAGWWNADGTATIYLAADPSSSAATLTLANRTGDALTLPAGSAAAYGGAAPGQGTLYLYFNGLLTNDEVSRIRVQTPGWTLRAYVDEPTGLAYLALSPSSPVPLAVGHTLTLDVAGAAATGSARAGNLTLVVDGVDGLPPVLGTLSIYVAVVAAPQAGNRKLELLVGFAGPDFVFTGGQQNELLLVLTNPGAQPLVPGGTAAWGSEPPTFTFSFVFAPKPETQDPGALTAGDVAGDMSVELAAEYGNFWDAVVPDDQGTYPTWSAQPSENGGGFVLGTGSSASVSFRISGIATTQPPGATYLYLAYTNVPGYDDGYFAVEIVKVAPIELELAAVPASVANAVGPTQVTLAYAVNNATYLTITNTPFAQAVTERVTGGDVYVSVASTTTFTLLASNHFTGQTAALSTTVTVSPDMYGLLPRGTVVMWSGDPGNVPHGWSLCDGTDGRPDLVSRFVMGAGTQGTTLGAHGGSANHSHAVNVTVAIDQAGDHQHGVPSNWYSNKAGSGGSVTVVDRDAKSVSNAKTQTAGQHTHPARASATVSSVSSLPPYYALAFIIKTS